MNIATNLRDAGLEAVEEAHPTWSESAREIVKGLTTFEGIGEELREIVEEKLGPCPTPNLWGAVVMHLVRDGTLLATDRLAAMKKPKSHARKSMVYVLA